MAARWATGLVLALAGLLLLPPGAHAATRNGLIAYESDSGVRVMRPDGTQSRPLLPGRDFSRPRFSPDGNSVLLISDTVERHDEIVVASLADDYGVRHLGVGGPIGWSPDSKRIAYARYQASTDTVEIHVAGVGGTGDKRIRTEPDPCLVGEFTTGIWWSAATDRIMYICARKLISIKPDGSDKRTETRLPRRPDPLFGLLNFDDPELSFDGTRFVGDFEGTSDLSTWNWRTGAETNATSDGEDALEEWAAWSGDGSRIVFADGGIGITGVNGGKTRVIAGAYAHPAWQPCVGGVTETCEPVTLDATRVPPLTHWDADPTLTGNAARQTGAGALAVTVGCSGRSVESCDVTVTAQTVTAVAAARPRKVSVARAAAKIRPGKKKTVKLTLRRQGRRLLQRDGRLKLRVTAAARRSDGRRQTATTRLTMRAKR